MDVKLSLGESGQALWDAVHSSRQVGPEHKSMLLNACRIADRLDAIAEDLAESPLTKTLYDKRGDAINEVANPLLSEHRMQLGALNSVLKQLGIERLSEAQDSGLTFAEKLAAAGELAALKVVK